MGAEPAGQLADPLDRGVPPLADDIGRPEPARQGNAVGVTAEDDDLLRTETTGGNDTAETHRAITDYGGDLARAHIRPERRVMARAHHVGEGEERRHESVVRADGKRDQRSVRQRDADRLALAAIERGAAPPSAVQARGLQTLLAEFAGAVGPGERRDDQVALLHRLHVGADGLDNADE